MARLVWSPRALRDVQRLHQFLAGKSPAAAVRAVQAIRSGVKVITLQPGIGRPIDELDVQYREWSLSFGDSGYVVRYRLDDNIIIILAVRHQRELGY